MQTSQLVKDPKTGLQVPLEQIEPTQANADYYFPPDIIGPVWAKDEDGQWLLPERTLGWDIIAWSSEFINGPDGDPWEFTPEQMRIILWIYSVDEQGRWCYQNMFYQALKGAGKDPFAAALCIIELLGPCRFDFFDPDTGEPIGKPELNAWVQVCGVSKDQTKNTMALFPSMINDAARSEYRVDVQKEIIYAMHGTRRIEAVTSSFRSLEGNRPTFVIANEVQHWIPSQGGHDLFNTLRGNVDKIKGGTARIMCISNAFQPGEDSVHQRIREAEEKVWNGENVFSGWFYSSIEAHPDAPLSLEWTPLIVNRIRGDAKWIDLHRITMSMLDGSQPTSRIRRMFYNQIVASEDSLYSPQEWDAIRDVNAQGESAVDFKEGDEIVLGFDGGKTDDATALVAIRIKDKLIAPIAVWEKPTGSLGKDWQVNRGAVDTIVNLTFRRYNVKAFYADVAEWEPWINSWSETYRDQLVQHASGKHAVAFDMRSEHQRVGRMHEDLLQTVLDGKIKHNGDKVLRRHTLQAKRRVNKLGFVTFGKDAEDSPRKVDAYAATLIAYVAMREYLESNKADKPNYTGRLYQF